MLRGSVRSKGRLEARAKQRRSKVESRTYAPDAVWLMQQKTGHAVRAETLRHHTTSNSKVHAESPHGL